MDINSLNNFKFKGTFRSLIAEYNNEVKYG